MYLRTSERCGGIGAQVRRLRRFLAVVEQWLSALRRKRCWHRACESGLLAGPPGARLLASGSGLLADTAPSFRDGDRCRAGADARGCIYREELVR